MHDVGYSGWMKGMYDQCVSGVEMATTSLIRQSVKFTAMIL
jgi:hypothetical protein